MRTPASLRPSTLELVTPVEPVQLIRHAMAKHIKEVAQELLYWMEELNKIESELNNTPASLQNSVRANG